jgi:uncharacterized protein YfaS (alpha-2-macroglobulin family)
LFERLFGRISWSAPPWLNALLDLRQHHRSGFRLALFAVLLLAGAAVAGYLYYQSLPKPLYYSATVTAPGITPLDDELVPQALYVVFEGILDTPELQARYQEGAPGVARLELIGQEVPAGIGLEPALPGKWTWHDENTLVFEPARDWPAGQTYRLRFEPTIFTRDVRLTQRAHEFTTPAFEVGISNFEFYQDPRDPRQRNVVATLSFTHPVDPESLEAHTGLGMRPSDETIDVRPQPQGLEISYDKHHREAYIHSDPVTIGEQENYMRLALEAGIATSLGGTSSSKAQESSVLIPSLATYFKVAGAQGQIVRDEEDQPHQALLLEFSDLVLPGNIATAIRVWLLPPKKQEWKRWKSPREVTDEVLARSEPVTLEGPSAEVATKLVSFLIDMPEERDLYLRLEQGLRSEGGFAMATPYDAVIATPAYPREAHIMSEGALIAKTGKRQLTLLTRGIQAAQVEIGRVLPGELNHLISQTSGDISNPDFNNYRFDADSISERFTRLLDLEPRHPREATYASVDLGRYLDDQDTRVGLFFIKVDGWDRKRKAPIHGVSDKRLVLISDLGLLVKDNADTSHDIFVQSISTGQPVAGASVELLGRNGIAVLAGTTGADGHTHLAETRDFEREQQPAVYVVRAGGDVSFIPFERNQRFLNYSRFDVGGLNTRHQNEDQLTAYLFSDRGIYRPGEEARLGIIVRRQDFDAAGPIPLEVQVTDPQGHSVLKQKLTLEPDGFFDLKHQTDPASPTGTYQAAIYLIDDRNRRKGQLGTTSFRVEEFQPDRLRIRTRLSGPPVKGWVSGADLKALVSLENLFGAPAQDRRVSAELVLSPAGFAFEEYAGFTFVDPFYDPAQPLQEVRETLPPQRTDAMGKAAFDIDLDRFEQGTYRLSIFTQGFEAGEGRSVSAGAATLISPLSRLIGHKTDGDLDHLNKGSEQHVTFIGIDPALKPVTLDDVNIRLVERQYVSTLVKQPDGTYRFQSVEQRKQHYERPFSIPQDGARYPLPTDQPGDFQLELTEASGRLVSRVAFTVVGARNLAADLEKNAELRLTLNKADYQPGEEIELAITAPYAGSGLITIERDRVYAFQWFHTTTNSTVQRIRLPEDIEGNAYVNVAFIRAADSREIFTSPLSYGVQPFSIDRSRRALQVDLQVPDRIKPGESLTVRYQTSRPARLIVFAVDEGILQVAGYQTPAPLDHFLRKRALEVRTAQIVDLILPEFDLVRALSASGGGQGAQQLLGRNLNPFARKADKPVAFWSGLVSGDTEVREQTFDIPDTFNGQLRIMAVAVSEAAMGAAEMKTLVRGPFVLTPNVPTAVAPGDEFEVTLGVANALEGSGENAEIELEVIPADNLQLLGETATSVQISEGSEGHAGFRLKVLPELGASSLVFRARHGEESARITATLSVRPPVPYVTTFESGFSASGQVELDVPRALYANLAHNRVAASVRPVVLTEGLIAYLDHFPHACTEQLVSRGYPLLAYLDHPDYQGNAGARQKRLAKLIKRLRTRQTAAGGFNLWPGHAEPAAFPSVYVLHFLTDAQAQGTTVPRDMLKRGLAWLRDYAGTEPTSLSEARWHAQALYILTRNGLLTTNHLVHLQEYLEAQYPKVWLSDIAAVYMAATYQLLRKQDDAGRLIRAYRPGDTRTVDWSDYDSQLAHDAQYVYLLARHFDDRFQELDGEQILRLVQPIFEGHYNTVSSAMAILALGAWSERVAATPGTEQVAMTEQDAGGEEMSLEVEPQPAPHARASVAARQVHIEGAPRLFYQLAQSGFDRALPDEEIRNGLEIVREYLGPDGKPVSDAKQGDELSVRLRVRALEGTVSNVAVIDLLPGGFEVLRDSIAREAGRWHADYTDIREDRVVFYGSFGPAVTELGYRVKLTARGRFVVPPATAEAMYDRSARAQTPGGHFEVTAAQ